MTEFSRELLFNRRWTAASKLDLATEAIATWDPALPRDVRLLVPIDVQALVVAAGSVEPMLRLQSATNDALTTPDFPLPFDPGSPRPAGVHLHWAMPDALLRGTLGAGENRNRLDLPVLPDRWVVLRLLTPKGADQVAVSGWVIEADRAAITKLADWPTAAAAASLLGAAITPGNLTGDVGGTVTWASTYDSVFGRFAIHDPLDDLATLAPDGVVGGAATYVVAGWWNIAEHDPLDAARHVRSLDAHLASLGWNAPAKWYDATADQKSRNRMSKTRQATRRLAAHAPVAEAPPVGANRSNDSIVQIYDVASSALFADRNKMYSAQQWWPHASLLHGAIYGVPLEASVADLDNRPNPGDVGLALGAHDDDAIAALVSSAMGVGDTARRDTERLLAAFTGQLMRELDLPDGAVAVEEHEHRAGFGSLTGGSLGTDRLLSGRPGTTSSVGRAGRRDHDAKQLPVDLRNQRDAATHTKAKMSKLFDERRQLLSREAVFETISGQDAGVPPAAEIAMDPRVVARPAPTYHFPLDPLMAIQGARRSLRHGNDARYSQDGRMWCRWPYETQRSWKGVVHGDVVLPSLGNGAIPEEVLLLAQEAVIRSPYHRRWLADVAARRNGLPAGAVRRRFDAEAALRYGKQGVYDGTSTAFESRGSAYHQRADVLDQMLNHSILEGVEPYPLGVTMWSQPWVPQWLEWTIECESSADLTGWTLQGVDLVNVAPNTGTTRTLTGRSLLTVGAARTLSSAVTDFLGAEDKLEKQTGGLGDLPQTTEDALAALAAGVEHLDLLTASLDGLRLDDLGVSATIDGARRTRDVDGTLRPPTPNHAPTFLTTGTVRVREARLVDTFGRVLDLSSQLAGTVVATRNDVPATPGALRLNPRLARPARWMFRLVDAASALGVAGAEARVDQVDPNAQINPVAGFLLPDHLDESMEVFDTAGNPIGELFHAGISGQVVWEIAPGRSGPPDSGPLYDLGSAQAPLGRLASGLVAADVRARANIKPPTETALSAALRAIDTTLWTVDTFAGMGSEHIAGLVGRPIAVVRAQLWLELQPETGLDLSDPVRREERVAAEQRLMTAPIPVRLGELTRTDDGLLGFFIDDDYEHFHLVDRTVAAMAKPSGPTGQRDPNPQPIEHSYLLDEDTLLVHYGQRLTLTLLMHPAGSVHLSSGVLPRKSLTLARDWVAPGLAAISPSLRTGPLLIDPDLVRLPKPTVFGTNQRFTRRVTPAAWRDDPILAATQSALLPDGATTVQDGYIRVMPDPEGSAS